MAEIDRTQPALLPIHQERLELALQAAASISMVAGPLQFMTAGHAEPELNVAHQLAIRIEQLAEVMLSALNDQECPPDSDLEEARITLIGPEMHRRRVREPENA